MGYMIEIEKHDAMELSDHIEKALHHAGRAMSIAEEMCNGGEMGYRSGMGYRNNGGYRGYHGGIGYRDEEMPEYDDYGNPMGMRRRDSRGRYM